MTYRLSFERADQQVAVIHAFLRHAYWATGIPRDVVERAIDHSICVGAFTAGGEQVGFARVVSDEATFAYLDDVFVLSEHRGRGLARRMIEGLQARPELQRLKTWLLFTADMQPMYAKFGFKTFGRPEIVMARVDREAWSR